MSEVKKLVTVDFNQPLTLSKEEIRSFIQGIEEEMKKHPEVEVPLKHYFSPGCYGREVVLKKDTLAVGKIHKYPCLTIISGGECSVLSIDGMVRVKAPYTFVSSPGAKRLVYAHEDTTWITVQATEETDIQKIEEHFVAKNYDEVPDFEKPEVIELKEVTCLT